MNDYYLAISFYRRRNYEKCIEVCNKLLQSNEKYKSSNDNDHTINVSSWLLDGIWQLKLQAQTQRVYIDDLDTNEDNAEMEDIEFKRLATAARPGTSIKTAFGSRPLTRNLTSSTGFNRPKTLTTRPITGTARPGTSSNRPGSSISSRPPTRCGTARRVRVATAIIYNKGDKASNYFQAARMNPTIYAEKETVVKPLFQYLFYHEGDTQKALSLYHAVAKLQKKVNWWWEQQNGRCLIAMNQPRHAEESLKKSLANFPHPDTYLLMCKMYLKLELPVKALEILDNGLRKNPRDISLHIHKARILEIMEQMENSVKCYKKIALFSPINVEALACIAVNYFYDNQPEISLIYYRRILSIGIHSSELYCNLAICCLHSGQLDLVLPCFQRSINCATTAEQRSDIWYNLSFVALNTGDFNLAKRCLRLCLSMDSANGAALNNLAVLSAQIGDYSKAKSYLIAAENTFTNCPEIESNLKFLEKF